MTYYFFTFTVDVISDQKVGSELCGQMGYSVELAYQLSCRYQSLNSTFVKQISLSFTTDLVSPIQNIRIIMNLQVFMCRYPGQFVDHQVAAFKLIKDNFMAGQFE